MRVDITQNKYNIIYNQLREEVFHIILSIQKWMALSYLFRLLRLIYYVVV